MLEEIFLNQQLGALGITNFLRQTIHWGVAQGYSLEFLLLLLLLPLAVSLVAVARYLIGIQGLGFFTPAMIAVAFLATGIVPGLIIFLAVLLIEILAIWLLKRLKIHFMAKMSLVLLIGCLAFMPFLFLSLRFQTAIFLNSALVPVLILVLIGENLAEVQLKKTPKKAIRATLETLVLASFSFLILNAFFLKKTMLLYPELMIIFITALNLWIGQFTGLRLIEYHRFRKLLKK